MIIDLDPQGNATTGFGLSNNENEKTIYDVFNNNCNFKESIKDTKLDNLKIVSSNVDLSGLEVETANETRRAFLLKDKIENFVKSQKNDYSYVFIDCPPSLSLLTIMSLVAAKSLIVPLQTEFFALEGLTQLMKTIDRVKIKLNPEFVQKCNKVYLFEISPFLKKIQKNNLITLDNKILKKIKWIKINYGQVLIFNQSLPHGNRVNKESETRWSLNCRFKNIFSPYGDKKIGEFFEPITLRAASEIGLKYKLPKMK